MGPSCSTQGFQTEIILFDMCNMMMPSVAMWQQYHIDIISKRAGAPASDLVERSMATPAHRHAPQVMATTKLPWPLSMCKLISVS